MRTTVTILAGAAAVLAAFHHMAASSSRYTRPATSNQCAHGREGQAQGLRDNASAFASDPDSAYAERRADFGLVLWPIDSVQLTQDPTVCAHVDSLIAV
jgi:hypothetical protein